MRASVYGGLQDVENLFRDEQKKVKKRKKVAKSTLSFALDDEAGEDETGTPSSRGDDVDEERSAKRSKSRKNPNVDTSFLPDREREEQERKAREEQQAAARLRAAELERQRAQQQQQQQQAADDEEARRRGSAAAAAAFLRRSRSSSSSGRVCSGSSSSAMRVELSGGLVGGDSGMTRPSGSSNGSSIHTS